MFYKNMLGKKLFGCKNKYKSSINNQVQLIKVFGKPRINVAGMLQSGGIINHIWKQGIEKCLMINGQWSRALILGLGGGSLVTLINQSYSGVKIVGVEIDPVMIDLGKKHFGLDKIENLEIVKGDAVEYVKKTQNSKLKSKKFDVVFVDLYVGDKYPKKAEKDSFVSNLNKIASKKGIVVFNRLFYGKHKRGVGEFVKKLEKYFKNIELQHVCSNLLVFCTN